MADAARNSADAGAGPSEVGLRRFVAYYRMSTPAQSRHGFSLEAQQGAVARYLAANPGKLIAEYAETKSGRNNQRPKIAEALQVCRIFGAILLIAQLDRLSRNVAMIAQLMESKVEFVALDFPHATRLTLHILAAIAEHESRMISDRVRLAHAAARARGDTQRFCRPNRKMPAGCQAASARLRHVRSQARIKDLAPLVWQAIGEGKSYAMIAEEFNRRGVRPQQHTPWQRSAIGSIARATADDFAATVATQPRKLVGLQQAGVLDRLSKIGPLLLDWRSQGKNYDAMARELNRLGLVTSRGGQWGRVSTWRYLTLAMGASSLRQSMAPQA